MNSLKTILLLAFLALSFSCKNPSVKAKAETTVQVYALDGSNPSGSQSGISVKFYESLVAITNNTPSASGVTDANGMAMVSIGIPVTSYYVIAQRGTRANYYNGLNPIGVFKTQQEIQTSPTQIPAGTIGGTKFRDTNGDGVITSADVLSPPVFSITPYYNTVIGTVIY